MISPDPLSLRRKKTFLFFCFSFVFAAAELLLTAHWLIDKTTSYKVFSSLSQIPEREYGLVLGTAPLTHGKENLFFKARILAAAQLYHAGKVRVLIVSGGGGEHGNYDEPLHMKQGLVSLGVPEDAIRMDRKGLRTLDSVLNMKTSFCNRDFIIVSQRDHCRRAVFLAEHHRVPAIGYDADAAFPLSLAFSIRKKNEIRESLARGRAVLDVIVHKTFPVAAISSGSKRGESETEKDMVSPVECTGFIPKTPVLFSPLSCPCIPVFHNHSKDKTT